MKQIAAIIMTCVLIGHIVGMAIPTVYNVAAVISAIILGIGLIGGGRVAALTLYAIRVGVLCACGGLVLYFLNNVVW